MTPDDFGSLYFIKLKGEGLNDNSEVAMVSQHVAMWAGGFLLIMDIGHHRRRIMNPPHRDTDYE